jgi:hypothetical protein
MKQLGLDHYASSQLIPDLTFNEPFEPLAPHTFQLLTANKIWERPAHPNPNYKPRARRRRR